MIKKSPNFAIVVWACLVMASSPWVAAQSPADAKWKPVKCKSADVIRFEAVGLTKTPGPDSATAPASSETLGIDQKAIEEILGRSGKVNAGILQFGVPRAETITENGVTVPPALGVATAHLIFSRPGAAKLQSPEISCSWEKKRIRP